MTQIIEMSDISYGKLNTLLDFLDVNFYDLLTMMEVELKNKESVKLSKKEISKKFLTKYISHYDEVSYKSILDYIQEIFLGKADITTKKYLKEMKEFEILIQLKYGYYAINPKKFQLPNYN